jgi:hypothetical protein
MTLNFICSLFTEFHATVDNKMILNYVPLIVNVKSRDIDFVKRLANEPNEHGVRVRLPVGARNFTVLCGPPNLLFNGHYEFFLRYKLARARS